VKRSEKAYESGGPWCKENPICRRQAMKIITPCYPQANTTSKVSSLQLLAIKTELSRGLAITQSIIDAKGSVPIEHALDRLLSPFSFFDRYTHYIMVTASAQTMVFPRFRNVSHVLPPHSQTTGRVRCAQRRRQHIYRG
jgi:hypothetical protein